MKCILKPVQESSPLVELYLKDGQKMSIGRGPETKITAKRCSKKQVELTANYTSKTVRVSQTGPNHSGLNGKLIGMGISAKAGEGDTIEVILGDLKYQICFEKEDSDLVVEPPKKIPKMFQPRGSPADKFKKDDLSKTGDWEVGGNNEVAVYVFGDNVKDSKPNVAAFDMDGTLITTKSGKVFPTGPEDWKFLYPSTVDVLQKYFVDHPDFKFVLFTNQAKSKDPKELDKIKGKMEKILREINIPAVAFIAPHKNMYRKPLTGGWDLFVERYNGGVVPDLRTSIYCGDAAGRKKDHAISDRLFALNIGITFQLPEEFFLKSVRVQEMSMPAFDPKQYLNNSPNNDHVQFGKGQEMIIMVGFPASGKSSYVKNVILPKGYVHVNRDTLKTQPKCLATAEHALQNGDSVVVDNTNPEKKDRAEYIKLAKKFRLPVRCFKLTVTHQHALHNNKFRELTNEAHVSIPAVVYNTFKSRYQEPVKEEGFTEIVPIHFVPNFDNFEETEKNKRMKLYTSYLLEK